MRPDASEDPIAIAGVASTGFSRTNKTRSSASYAYEAAVEAIRDAGLGRDDIDGVVSSLQLAPGPDARELVAALGLPRVRFFGDGGEVMISSIISAMNAIRAGSASAVLVYHPNYRSPYQSRQAAADPFRVSIRGVPAVDSVRDASAYAAWAARYFYENRGAKREHLGYVAINSRTNAAQNPLAVFRQPLTMDEYLSARMVRDPLCLFDMDVPVDGADAFVLTTRERARELDHVPVLIRTAVAGIRGANDEDQMPSLEYHAQDVVVEQLREHAEFGTDDIDVAFLYDGFTNITLSWLEKLGWCSAGEAGGFLEEHWSSTENRVLIGGRLPINPHGGALSEGATQGAGHLREAVYQLRGEASDRQIPGARSALLAIGGFFFNAQAAMLVSDSGGAR